jgi:polygalacturonase
VFLQLDGNIVAPNTIWTTTQHENLLTFYRADNLTVDGSGQIDGRGAIWWTCFNQKVGYSAHNSCFSSSIHWQQTDVPSHI